MIIPILAAITMGLLYLFVLSTFFLASFVDPGIYPRGESHYVDRSSLPEQDSMLSMGLRIKFKGHVVRHHARIMYIVNSNNYFIVET